MPIRYRVNSDTGLIETECIGDVRYDEVLAHFAELESDPNLPKRPDVLLDMSRMDSVPESGQLRSVAAQFDRFPSRIEWGACAIVAETDLLFGMSRMFQVFAESHFADSSVVRTRSEAVQWLESRRGPDRS